MITPNKFTSFEASAISRLPLILENLQTPLLVSQLYTKTENEFASIDQFMYAIDVLYTLGRIELTKEGVVKNVA
jgi:hypothetical protein